MYLLLGLGTFFFGVQHYGGYISFISTPYTPIYGGSAENEIKDTLISSSGLLVIFSVVSYLSSSVDKQKQLFSFFFYLLVLFFAGAELYLREVSSISCGTFIPVMLFAVLF